MPRTVRRLVGGVCYHVVNRGNAQATVFHTDAHYHAFIELISKACSRIDMRVIAFCLMPNHFHFVLRPWADGDLSRWMQWLTTTQVRRHHRLHGSSGHVWQGRFKAFPVQRDEHLLTVIRYVERNALRAGLVQRAEDWPWNSLHWRASGNRPSILADIPIALPPNWLAVVNDPQTPAELERLRRSVNRGTPFGGGAWSQRTAETLGLGSSLRPRGRPRRSAE